MKKKIKNKYHFKSRLAFFVERKSIFLLMFLMVSACGDKSNQESKAEKKYIPHEQDMRLLQLEFYDNIKQSKPLRMNIPLAFFQKHWARSAIQKPQPVQITRGRVVRIKTIFPELTPHPQSFGKTGKFSQGLFIYMQSGDASADYSDDWYEKGLGFYGKKYQFKSADFFGFHQYEIDCPESRCTGDDFDYLISGPEFVGTKTFGRCYKPEKNSGGGCSFFTSYNGKGLEYIFRRTQLPIWREIDAYVRQLLDSFLVK